MSGLLVAKLHPRERSKTETKPTNWDPGILGSWDPEILDPRNVFNGVDGFVGFGAFGGFDGRDQSEGSGADWTGMAAGNGGWSPLLQIFVQPQLRLYNYLHQPI